MELSTPAHGKENARFDTPAQQKNSFGKTPFKNISTVKVKTPFKTPLVSKVSILVEKTNKIDTPRHATPLLKTVLQRTTRKETVKKPEKGTKSKLSVYQDQQEVMGYFPPPAVEKCN
jgi:hypothetical protein